MTPEKARDTIAKQTQVYGHSSPDAKYRSWIDLQEHYGVGGIPTLLFNQLQDNAMELYAQHNLELELLFERHKKFAHKTFPESTAESSLLGLEREIQEIRNEPDKRKKGIEYIDGLFYWADSFSRAGFTFNDMKVFMKEKLSINENRDWNKNPDNSYSHIKQ